MKLIRRVLSLLLSLSITLSPITAYATDPRQDSLDENNDVNLAETIHSSAEIGAIVYGTGGTAVRLIGENRFTLPTGHGFAAERGNNLVDQLKGINATITGDNNATNGADRLIISEGSKIWIQTKYHATATSGIADCFENGTFRYLNADGTPMQIEVPADQYEQAVSLMRNRIARGEVPGVTNPDEATNLIRKGHLKYKQAVNLAKAGTVESLSYDAINGTVVAASAFGISSVITFVVCKLNGDDNTLALKTAATTGLKSSGIAFVTSVIASQLSKTSAKNLFTPAASTIVEKLSPRAVSALAALAPTATGTAKDVATKILGNNMLTAAVTIAVIASADVVRMFKGRISASQLWKNILITAAGVGAGTAGGLVGGAAIGSLFPGPGTAIGGIVGTFVGGFAGSAAANKLVDYFTETDTEKMLSIIQDEFQVLADEYIVNLEEADNLAEQVTTHIKQNSTILLDMFESKDRTEFARGFMEPMFSDLASAREYIELPSEKEMSVMLTSLLEDVIFVH